MNKYEKRHDEFAKHLQGVMSNIQLQAAIERPFSSMKPRLENEKVIVCAGEDRRMIAVAAKGEFEISEPTRNGTDLSGYSSGVKCTASQLATELGKFAGFLIN